MLAIRQIVPDELERDILKASAVLTGYDQIKNCVLEQVAIRRDVKTASEGRVPMDMNMVKSVLANIFGEVVPDWQEDYADAELCGTCGVDGAGELLSFANRLNGGEGSEKGKNGKDGGIGKGRTFEGNCNLWGKYGHRVSEYWEEDEEVQKREGV